MPYGRPTFQGQRRRHLRRRVTRRSDTGPALALDDVTSALGRRPENDCGRRIAATVPVADIVGTVARSEAFDRAFRPRQGHLRERWERLAARAGAESFEPVDLVRIGETFFVEDGHHRVSVARSRGQQFVDAAVRSLCTVAFAPRDLVTAQLTAKAAERDFLHSVPLPDPALRSLALGDPDAYRRLGHAARAWSDARGLTSPRPGCVIDRTVATAWWHEDVLPRGGPAVVAD